MSARGAGGDSGGVVPPGAGVAPIPVSPCTLACPLGINVKAYVGLIAAGRPLDAAAVVRERTPLPSVCGRICAAPCERECPRGRDGAGPVAIRALKRFVADVEFDRRASSKVGPPRVAVLPGRVAVVGSGPAGLVAAHDLAIAGCAVTLVEASDVLGGLLTHGVPAFRLARDALRADIEAIVSLGIDVRTGVRADPADPGALLAGGFAAVVLATGGSPPPPQPEPRSPEEGVVDAGAVVRAAARGEAPALGDRVAVLAAPGAATLGLAAARIIRRSGAARVIFSPAVPIDRLALSDEDLAGAVRDGVEILRAARVGPAPGMGRRVAVDVGRDGSTEAVEVDAVVVARARFWADAPSGSPLRRSRIGTVAVDPVTLATSVPGVFAAGEACTGPRGAVEAMASGRRAARSVISALRSRRSAATTTAIAGGEVVPDLRGPAPESGLPMSPRGVDRWRPPAAPPAVSARLEDPDPGMSEPQAAAEAGRCLMCGPCEECRRCTPTCDFVLVDLGRSGSRGVGRVDRVAASAAAAGAPGPARPPWTLAAARVDRSLCVGCGICAEACPWNIPRIGSRRGRAPASDVDAGRCRSCGICVAACPAGAIAQAGWAAGPEAAP